MTQITQTSETWTKDNRSTVTMNQIQAMLSTYLDIVQILEIRIDANPVPRKRSVCTTDENDTSGIFDLQCKQHHAINVITTAQFYISVE